MRPLLWMAMAVLVASCGVKRPLMRPAEIPAYEEKMRRKQERLQQDQETAAQGTAAEGQ